MNNKTLFTLVFKAGLLLIQSTFLPLVSASWWGAQKSFLVAFALFLRILFHRISKYFPIFCLSKFQIFYDNIWRKIGRNYQYRASTLVLEKFYEIFQSLL